MVLPFSASEIFKLHISSRRRKQKRSALLAGKILLYSRNFKDRSHNMTEKLQLKRELGLLEVTISGMGIILGAGIYALIGEATALAGNAVWISFALSAIVAIFTGLSYAELSSIFPKASAEYEYTINAFGPRTAFVTGWLIIFSSIIGAATVALGFGGYFNALTGAPLIPSALALVLILSGVLMIGIKQSAMVAIVFTLIESSGLVLIIALGIPRFGAVNYLEAPLGIDGILRASALIFFAFIGFEEIVKLSEETREPEKVIPKSLLLAIAASITLYILVSISAVSVLGWQRLSQSSAPFGDIAFAVFGQNAFFILSVIALFATTNTVLLMLLAASRITYGMAQSGSIPSVLSRVSESRRAPWAAILSIMAITMVFVFLRDIGLVASVTNFTLFVTFAAINSALIILRYRSPDMARPFRVPGNIGSMPVIPLIGVFFNLFMLSQLSFEVIAIGIGLTVIGGLLSLRKGEKEKKADGRA